MKKSDFLFVAIILMLAGGLYFSGILRPGEKGARAVIYVDGTEYKSLSLLEDTVFKVEQKGKINIVTIEDGYAVMTEASCPDKLCVKQKKIFLQDETIVCLPNKVVVQIENGIEQDMDSIAK